MSTQQYVTKSNLSDGMLACKCDLDSTTEKAMGQPSFHRKKQAEISWAHKSVTGALDLFRYSLLSIDEKTTEADVRKDAGHKVDMIISYLNFEYGCAEAGLKGGITSSKWINEANIKVPRLIEDMFWNMLKPSPGQSVQAHWSYILDEVDPWGPNYHTNLDRPRPC
ncbi:hypothetical protein BDC45DRAFT_535899 [Circinella umbellata]|nr:hypothetical protein BDC45DRAFT_535899 [Circinella umbellata]